MVTATEFEERRDSIRSLLTQFKDGPLAALLITHLPNVRYLSGFTGSNAMLLLSQAGDFFFTDPRYDIQAAEETTCKVKVVSRGPLLPEVIKSLSRRKLRNTGFEQSFLPYSHFRLLNEKLPLGFTLTPTTGVVEVARQIKSAAEIALIRESMNTNSKAYESALQRVRAGMAEGTFASEIEYRMRKFGASGTSFDTIVASGARAALPHARPGSAPISRDQLLLIDMGCMRNGYASDMTRTVFLNTATRTWRTRYKAVLEAQLAALNAVRDGVAASKPDAAARKVLESYGLDKAFTHSTGHGLGLEIHEAPRLGKREKTKLRAGMVVTIEPGIYLKDEGGIRIEDSVLVTASGCEILTNVTKELTVLA